MLKISKTEPLYFTHAKSKVREPNIKGAWGDNNIALIREQLRDDILNNEQNGLCVYCEKKILSCAKKSNIDHFETRNLVPEKTLDYQNLFVSCNTRGRCSNFKDSRKSPLKYKADYENIVYPLKEGSDAFFDYLTSGEITPLSDKEAFTVEVFNLNQQSLRDERKLLADTLMCCGGLSLEEIFEAFGYEFQSFIQSLYPKLENI